MKKMLVTANDAGGAEVLSSWVKYHSQHTYDFILSGPAVQIFKKKLDVNSNVSLNNIERTLNNYDCVLTGTSWSSDLERKIILFSKLYNKFVITMLDHWCDYSERFLYCNKLVLPDEIWVTDKYAYEMAASCFSSIKINLEKNYYLLDFKKTIEDNRKPRTQSTKFNILFICEPIADYALQQFGSANYFNYNEFEALHYFLKSIHESDYKDKIASVKIRLHPSEVKTKYDEILKLECALPVLLSNENLIEDIQWADWVVGCSSIVLIQALEVNKKVYTCVPQGAQVFKFPHKEISEFPRTLEN